MDNNTTPEPNVVHDPELAGMAIAMGAYAVMENCHGNSAGCYTGSLMRGSGPFALSIDCWRRAQQAPGHP